MAARLQNLQLLSRTLLPSPKMLRHPRQEAGELGMGRDRGLQLRRGHR